MKDAAEGFTKKLPNCQVKGEANGKLANSFQTAAAVHMNVYGCFTHLYGRRTVGD